MVISPSCTPRISHQINNVETRVEPDRTRHSKLRSLRCALSIIHNGVWWGVLLVHPASETPETPRRSIGPDVIAAEVGPRDARSELARRRNHLQLEINLARRAAQARHAHHHLSLAAARRGGGSKRYCVTGIRFTVDLAHSARRDVRTRRELSEAWPWAHPLNSTSPSSPASTCRRGVRREKSSPYGFHN